MLRRNLRSVCAAYKWCHPGPHPVFYTTAASHPQVFSATAVEHIDLADAVRHCLIQLPRDRTPSLTTLVVSQERYGEALPDLDVASLLPHGPVMVCAVNHATDALTQYLTDAPSDRSPAFVALTTLYLPPEHLCCPFHSTNDSVPSLQSTPDTKLPLSRYIGKEGEKLNFVFLTGQMQDSSTFDPVMHLQRRLRNLFNNGELVWLGALGSPQFWIHGTHQEGGIGGIAMSCPDSAVLAQFLLQMFRYCPLNMISMSQGLFTDLFQAASDTTRPSEATTPDPIDGTVWRAIYPGHGPEVVTVSQTEAGLAAVKLTGDVHVPAGEVTWRTAACDPLPYGQRCDGEIQVAHKGFMEPRYMDVSVNHYNDRAVEVIIPPMDLGPETRRPDVLVYTKMALESGAGPEPRLQQVPVFHVPGCAVLPHGYAHFIIFELRFRRMIRRAMETGELIGIVDGNISRKVGMEHVVGTVCRLVHVDCADNTRWNVTVQGIGRFQMKKGAGAISEFGLHSPECTNFEDSPLTEEKLSEAWGLAQDVGEALKYNPMEHHLKGASRDSAALTQVSFGLAAQMFDDYFLSPKAQEIYEKARPQMERAVGALCHQLLSTQCPLQRLEILVTQKPPRPKYTQHPRPSSS